MNFIILILKFILIIEIEGRMTSSLLRFKITSDNDKVVEILNQKFDNSRWNVSVDVKKPIINVTVRNLVSMSDCVMTKFGILVFS